MSSDETLAVLDDGGGEAVLRIKEVILAPADRLSRTDQRPVGAVATVTLINRIPYERSSGEVVLNCARDTLRSGSPSG
jgi:hypothetical protein